MSDIYYEVISDGCRITTRNYELAKAEYMGLLESPDNEYVILNELRELAAYRPKSSIATPAIPA